MDSDYPFDIFKLFVLFVNIISVMNIAEMNEINMYVIIELLIYVLLYKNKQITKK
jgi:hypothetical protein